MVNDLGIWLLPLAGGLLCSAWVCSNSSEMQSSSPNQDAAQIGAMTLVESAKLCSCMSFIAIAIASICEVFSADIANSLAMVTLPLGVLLSLASLVKLTVCIKRTVQ